MKKLFTFFAAILCAASMWAQISGSCGSGLTWELDFSEHSLTITGSGAMASYYVGDVPWYNYTSSIQKVYISSGVTRISRYAFATSDHYITDFYVAWDEMQLDQLIIEPNAFPSNTMYMGTWRLHVPDDMGTAYHMRSPWSNMYIVEDGGYSEIKTCGPNLTWEYNSSTHTLTISGYGPMSWST